MNEIVFFCHIAILSVFIFSACKMGKPALIALCAFQAVLANLFVTKQICLFGLTVTATDAFAIGGILTFNLIQEFYGKEMAKKTLYVEFLLLIFFALMGSIHLLYKSSEFDMAHSSFHQILSSSPRIVLASLTTFMIVQRIDIKLFSYFRKFLALTPTILISLLITQLIDTALFSVLGLLGHVHSLLSIILLSYLIKVITACCMIPSIKWIKKVPHEV